MNRLSSRPLIGIRFSDYVFSDPAPLSRFSLPPRAMGLYVILMPDASWGPWHLQPLFFGEFGPARDVHMSQAQQACCLKVAAGRSLYFALYAVPHQHGWAISEIQKELIARYGPIANLESIDASTDLVQRLDALEKKMIEQDAVLKLALATFGQTVQLQQPEPKKRIVGFQPDPAGLRASVTAVGKPHSLLHRTSADH
jgi:hypothetical protein